MRKRTFNPIFSPKTGELIYRKHCLHPPQLSVPHLTVFDFVDADDGTGRRIKRCICGRGA